MDGWIFFHARVAFNYKHDNTVYSHYSYDVNCGYRWKPNKSWHNWNSQRTSIRAVRTDTSARASLLSTKQVKMQHHPQIFIQLSWFFLWVWCWKPEGLVKPARNFYLWGVKWLNYFVKCKYKLRENKSIWLKKLQRTAVWKSIVEIERWLVIICLWGIWTIIRKTLSFRTEYALFFIQ